MEFFFSGTLFAKKHLLFEQVGKNVIKTCVYMSFTYEEHIAWEKYCTVKSGCIKAP